MASRLLTVTLQQKYYQSSIPIRTITYSDSQITLTDEEYENIISELPSFWNTENDRLRRFIVFSDKTYFCEREKKYFNYSTRESEDKIYRFDYATQEEAESLYKYFIEKYAKIKISRSENLYDSIMDQIKDLSFMKYSLLDARDELLNKSDFVMMPDYPISEEKREQWATYRQELRDLTKQDAWIRNDLMSIKMPISPLPLSQIEVMRTLIDSMQSIPSNLSQEIIDSLSDKPVEELLENITEITVKFEILKTISKMKIPILAINDSEITTNQEFYENSIKNAILENLDEASLPENWWEAATENIDQKIKEVNETLQRYKVDFTINDILDAIVEQNKLSDQDIEVNEILEDL